VTRRIVFRAAGLVLLGCAVVAGLTVYFSAEKVPPCLLSGIPEWKAPTDRTTHHFEVVVPDRALCFFDMDDEHHLVGYLKLPHIEGINAIQPRTGSLALRYGHGQGALVDLQDGSVEYGVTPPPAPRDRIAVPDLRSGVPNLWSQDVFAKAPSRQLTHFSSGKIWACAYSLDGKLVALAHGSRQGDAVIFSSPN
jgi:hypothetical protein